MNNIWAKESKIETNSYFNQGDLIFKKVKNKNNKFVHVDLFSGCGGFSVGFEQSGFITEVAIDIHKPSIDTINFNHKKTSTILGDIRKVNVNSLKSLLSGNNPKLVITAGVPCQGFSRSNRKRNDDDERNFYFEEFIRITKSLNPEVVVLENVSGISSAKDGYFKRNITKAISELNYNVHISFLNSEDFGVPQKRRRIFFVGVKKQYNWLFPYPTHDSSNYVTVGDAILGDLPPLRNNSSKEKYISNPINEFQKKIRSNQNILLNHTAPNHPEKTIKMIESTKQGEPLYEKFKQRIRLGENKPSPTQICGGIRPQFQFAHPTQNRGLTIRERARIQSFPDDYFFEGGIVQGRVQTGNAVPVFVSRVIAEQIMSLLKGEKIQGTHGEYINLSTNLL